MSGDLHQAQALADQAEACYRTGRLTEAETACRRLVALQPAHPMTHYNLARVLKDRGKAEPAMAALRKALTLAPDLAEGWLNLGSLLADAARWEEAQAAFERGLAVRPGGWPLLAGLARVALARGDHATAEACLERALALAPEAPLLRTNLGTLLLETGRVAAAKAQFEQALAQAPTHPEALLGAGHAARRLGDEAGAIAFYARAVAARPGDPALLARLSEARLGQCDWSGIDRLRDELIAPALARRDDPIGPMLALSLPLSLSPAEMLTIARRRAERVAAEARTLTPRPRPARPGRRERLTIGYLSADFHDHPTAHLMRGLLAAHDRNRVRVVALSLGADDGSAYRQAVRDRADLFLDLAPLDLPSAAARIVAADVDILVDINVHTRGNRLALTALRPAPVTAAWLGLPGSSGANFIDWAIVDPVVAPPGAEAGFSERLLVLPHCYQPNDDTQESATDPLDRAACGLPATGFVYCCFNQAFKIEPVIFACWMRILDQVPDSVLWLLSRSAEMEANLRREAAARGIDPRRLVFAPRQPKAQHLARHRLAGLCLDTLFYNAHTTASDALWAGVPVLTVPGQTFASRVAASLLTSLGLTELICPDLAAYEAQAVAVGQTPVAMAALVQRLVQARTASPLFDTAGFTRTLERGFELMWDAACTGYRPRRLNVPAE